MRRRRGGRAARLKQARAEAPTAPRPCRSPARPDAGPAEGRVLFICCGSLSRGIKAVAERNGWDHVDVESLPAELHNQPDKIPDLLRERIATARPYYNGRIFIGYGDCGTGGEIDRLCREENLRRIPGPHCYSFLSGNARFARSLDDHATTFFLTDHGVDNFQRLVIEDLWIDKHAELLDLYFGHYEKLVYLAQDDDPERDREARRAARLLGLDYERRLVGWGDLEGFVEAGALADKGNAERR